MSANTSIEWADHTFNPWEGCQKVGPGCDHCYAETRNARFAGGRAINWGPGAPRRRTSAKNWNLPIKWNAEAAAKGIRYRVFCASLADVFDNEVDPAWRKDLFELIGLTPHLDWLLLTKRIGNAHLMIEKTLDWLDILASQEKTRLVRKPWPWHNVWLGATIVSQEEADRDIPKLLAVPAAKRFLSMEPLLGSVNISKYMWPVHGWWCGPYQNYREAKAAGADCGLKRQALISADWAKHLVNWVIVGGESGPGARPMHPDWARSLRDQCEAAGVPFFYKQWGEWLGQHQDGAHNHDPIEVNATDGPLRVGKKAAGRMLDGRTWDQVPS